VASICNNVFSSLFSAYRTPFLKENNSTSKIINILIPFLYINFSCETSDRSEWKRQSDWKNSIFN
jgi:hypothetical protein